MKNICHNFYRKIIFNASALSSGTIQIPVGKHENIYSIHFHKRFIIYY